jgi:tRNA threonylcarbamoyladenosine biosynthesis protein TsaB
VLEEGLLHGRELVPAVARVLEDARWRREEVALVAAGCGPGSYTGTRIGIAAARALCMAWGCPGIGVSTLHALVRMAAPAGRTTTEDGERAWVFRDARRGEWYAGSFAFRQGGWTEEREVGLVKADRWHRLISDDDWVVCEQEDACRDRLEGWDRLLVVPEGAVVAEGVARAAMETAAGSEGDTASLRPVYVRSVAACIAQK